MPGARTARPAVMTALAAMATPMFGARAKTTRPTDDDRSAQCDRKPRTCSGPLASSRVAMRAPRSARRAGPARPRRRRSPGPARRGRTPPRRAATASDTKPMSDAARNGSDHQIRRSVSIFHTMRHPSANDGVGSSVSSASPVGAHRPALVGAPDRLLEPQARTTKISVGKAKTMNGARQPYAAASRPADERPDERADGVGGAVERVHPGPVGDVVVVGQQRVVGRVDDGLADARAGPGDAEDEQRRRQAGEQREQRPRRARRRRRW